MKNKKKIPKFGELAVVIGTALMALGTALASHAGMGVSMVVAPAYVISEKIPLTFGQTEWCFQALLLTVFCIVMKRFRVRYLLSFGAALIYGAMLDFWNLVVFAGLEPANPLLQWGLMLASMVVVSIAVAFCFNSYMPQQIYELFVKDVSEKYKLNRNKFKIIYDYSSLALALVLSLILFHTAWGRGIRWGTVVTTLFNGLLIALFSRLLNRFIDFSPALPKVHKELTK